MEKVMIGKKQENKVIPPELHSQFIEFLGTCISEGIWVGKDSDIPNYNGMRKDVIDAMAKLQPPVIRWPGGCYADMYHWRDGVGTERKVTWNENFGTYEKETNEFGTHEFMEFCERVGAKPWLNINMLRGSVAEMVEWAEYCNRKEDTTLSRERAANGHEKPFDVEFWGIGNECWAGGGNYTAQGYAAEYRKFASAMPAFKPVIPFQETEGLDIKLIASGPDGNKPIERVKWTRDFFKSLSEYRLPKIDALDLHFYNWNINMDNLSQPEEEFTEAEWYSVIYGCLELEDVIREQIALIQEGLKQLPPPEGDLPGNTPSCKLVVGEWGNWHGSAFLNRPALYQQCTMRDAITTAMTLDIFHRNCDHIGMACVAQTVNVLNSLILTQGERTILTPNYYIFEMYKPHREGALLELEIETEKISAGENKSINTVYSLASVKENVITLNLVNTNMTEAKTVELSMPQEADCISAKVLAADDVHACNTAEDPEHIITKDAKLPETSDGKVWKIDIPAASVNVYQFRLP